MTGKKIVFQNNLFIDNIKFDCLKYFCCSERNPFLLFKLEDTEMSVCFHACLVSVICEGNVMVHRLCIKETINEIS